MTWYPWTGAAGRAWDSADSAPPARSSAAIARPRIECCDTLPLERSQANHCRINRALDEIAGDRIREVVRENRYDEPLTGGRLHIARQRRNRRQRARLRVHAALRLGSLEAVRQRSVHTADRQRGHPA